MYWILCCNPARPRIKRNKRTPRPIMFNNLRALNYLQTGGGERVLPEEPFFCAHNEGYRVRVNRSLSSLRRLVPCSRHYPKWREKLYKVF